MPRDKKLTRTNASEHLAARDKDELALLDKSMGGYEEKPIDPPKPLPRPTVHRRLPPHVRTRNEAPMKLTNLYAAHLLALGLTKFVEQTLNPTGSFENRNENRDLFLVSALQSAKMDIVAACKTISEQMTAIKAPSASVQATIDALLYNVLKQTIFSVWLDFNRALRVEEGVMPDSFFEKLTVRRPAPENAEDTPEDLKAGPNDHREAAESAPPGLNSDYVVIGDFEWQIEDEKPLHCRIAEGLEDLRVYLETVRTAMGVKTDQRLAFFTEQIAGQWVRHEGNVYDAINAFDQKQAARNTEKAVTQDMFFRNQAKALMASVE
jgi:hypothetical protein